MFVQQAALVLAFPDIEVSERHFPGPAGALDLFLDEDMEYARRLLRAGVPTELHVYPGAYHGFNLAAEAQATQAFDRDILGSLRRAFARPA